MLNERFGSGKVSATTRSKNKKQGQKKTKTPTHLITLSLLQEKLSLELIAKKRELSIGTIITHIEKLKGLKLLDHPLMESLKQTISVSDFDVIFDELQKSEDGRLQPIYDQFKGRYEYHALRMVRLFV